MRRYTSVLCALAVGVAATAGIAGLAAQPKPTPARPAPPTPKPAPPKIVKDPPPPAEVGLVRAGELRPGAQGYVDDSVAVVGDKLLTLVRDGAGKTILTTIAAADGKPQAQLDLTTLAPEPIRVHPVGDKLFVVHGAEPPPGGRLVDPAAQKVVREHRHATSLAVRPIGGKPVVVAYNFDEQAKGGPLHEVTIYDLVSGKKIAKKGKRLQLGRDGRDAKLDFRPVYFLDDHTVAVGVKGGVWRKADNQRSPDTWAAYDLVTGAWLKNDKIGDPMALARRQPVLAAHPNERVFARIAEDLSAVEAWRDGNVSEITLDQPLEIYDPLSVQYAMRGDTLWMSLTVEPTNAPAVKRQKADPRYLDLFEVDGDKATRRARLLVQKQGARWGWAGDTWWVLEKSAGFTRGGPVLTLYKLP